MGSICECFFQPFYLFFSADDTVQWRFYTFFALFTLELVLLTRNNAVFVPAAFLPDWLASLFGLENYYLLPFQVLSLARSASVTLNIFLSQLAPPAKPTPPSSASGAGLKPKTQRQLLNLAQLSHAHKVETTRLLQTNLAPFRGDKGNVMKLRSGMRNGLIMRSVKDDPEVKQAIENAKERRNNVA